MTIQITHRWRAVLVLAGAGMAYGGSLHPDADAEDSLREELAAMTSSDTWVRSHVFIALGTALLALGLWSAHRHRSWPASARTALRVAAVSMSLYFVETLFHLASVADSGALANGDAAPIAFTHVGLALVLYPVSGLSFAWLNGKLLRAVDLPRTPLTVVGILAGLLHASSVPLTIALPDTELTTVFAGAGMLLAIWSVGWGLAGMRTSPRPFSDTAERPADPVGPALAETSTGPDRVAAHRSAASSTSSDVAGCESSAPCSTPVPAHPNSAPTSSP